MVDADTAGNLLRAAWMSSGAGKLTGDSNKPAYARTAEWFSRHWGEDGFALVPSPLLPFEIGCIGMDRHRCRAHASASLFRSLRGLAARPVVKHLTVSRSTPARTSVTLPVILHSPTIQSVARTWVEGGATDGSCRPWW